MGREGKGRVEERKSEEGGSKRMGGGGRNDNCDVCGVWSVLTF